MPVIEHCCAAAGALRYGDRSGMVPAGTTQLLQNTQCGAGRCPAGATMHTFSAAITINDPTAPGSAVLKARAGTHS